MKKFSIEIGLNHTVCVLWTRATVKNRFFNSSSLFLFSFFVSFVVLCVVHESGELVCTSQTLYARRHNFHTIDRCTNTLAHMCATYIRCDGSCSFFVNARDPISSPVYFFPHVCTTQTHTNHDDTNILNDWVFIIRFLRKYTNLMVVDCNRKTWGIHLENPCDFSATVQGQRIYLLSFSKTNLNSNKFGGR